MVSALILKQRDPMPRNPTAKAAASLLGPWAPAEPGASICMSHGAADGRAQGQEPAGTATYPVAHDASETLGAWQARLPYAAFPALQTEAVGQHPPRSTAGNPPPPGSLGANPPGSLGRQVPREGLAGPEPPESQKASLSPALPTPGAGGHRSWPRQRWDGVLGGNGVVPKVRSGTP